MGQEVCKKNIAKRNLMKCDPEIVKRGMRSCKKNIAKRNSVKKSWTKGGNRLCKKT